MKYELKASKGCITLIVSDSRLPAEILGEFKLKNGLTVEHSNLIGSFLQKYCKDSWIIAEGEHDRENVKQEFLKLQLAINGPDVEVKAEPKKADLIDDEQPGAGAGAPEVKSPHKVVPASPVAVLKLDEQPGRAREEGEPEPEPEAKLSPLADPVVGEGKEEKKAVGFNEADFWEKFKSSHPSLTREINLALIEFSTHLGPSSYREDSRAPTINFLIRFFENQKGKENVNNLYCTYILARLYLRLIEYYHITVQDKWALQVCNKFNETLKQLAFYENLEFQTHVKGLKSRFDTMHSKIEQRLQRYAFHSAPLSAPRDVSQERKADVVRAKRKEEESVKLAIAASLKGVLSGPKF